MALHTPFTELVGCAAPIQLAPMGGICTPELIAAVTDAGGIGGFAALFLPPEQLERMLAAIQYAEDVVGTIAAAAERLLRRW